MVEQSPEDNEPFAILAKLRVGLDDIQRHILLPDNLRETTERIFLRAIEPRFLPKVSSIFSFFYWLDTSRLEKRLHEILSPCVMGYSLELRQSGSIVFSRQWQWAKSSVDTRQDWTGDTPMHLASVSKLITAISFTRLLDRNGISCDERIAPWLPQYWPRGINVDTLTFRHLLAHKSGLFKRQFPNAAGPCDFQGMKEAIGAGTIDVGTSDYKNINYSLCRILLATVNGDVGTALLANPSSSPALAPLFGARNAVWDLLTISAYKKYVNDWVFTPAGVAPRAFEHTEDCALAYGLSPDTTTGWNSSDLQAASAAVGWHLSVREMLRVIATFRRKGTIMSASRAQRMLENEFGVDIARPTRIGMVYAKGGWWQKSDTEQKVEQSNAFILPRSMELVILANSPSCRPATAFFGSVAAAIDECIEPWIARLWR